MRAQRIGRALKASEAYYKTLKIPRTSADLAGCEGSLRFFSAAQQRLSSKKQVPNPKQIPIFKSQTVFFKTLDIGILKIAWYLDLDGWNLPEKS